LVVSNRSIGSDRVILMEGIFVLLFWVWIWNILCFYFIFLERDMGVSVCG